MDMIPRLSFAALILLAGWSPLAFAATGAFSDCPALTQVALPQAQVASAQRVAAGAFRLPNAKADAPAPRLFLEAPAFCRVRIVATPSPDSHIEVEVWLPVQGWNGRLRGQGNGGFAGYVNYAGLATAVSQGYASASTNTGHTGGGAAWALGHPQKVIDFGYRAIHLMTLDAKTLVKAFYGRPARYAYFASCSNGGRQALMEAQRFPDDYDGVIAGAPAYDWTHLLTNALGIVQQADSPSGYIPPSKLSLITHAVLKACDANDGVVDGVLGDPRRCGFDPSMLRCTKGDSGNCLTSGQVATLKRIYGGARDGAGERLYYGAMPGAEDGGSWKSWFFGPKRGQNAMAFFVNNYFADMVYGDPDWNYRGADLGAALAAADRKTGEAMNATDADLQPFASHGGKLILYHGWNDPAIPPLGTIAYYKRVAGKLGEKSARQSVRLYMVPGMLHCDGGPGAHSFGQNATDARRDADHDIFVALVRWVEQGKPPRTLVATRYAGSGDDRRVKMTRPLCPYPQTARYGGTGDASRAAAFVCSTQSADQRSVIPAQAGIQSK